MLKLILTTMTAGVLLAASYMPSAAHGSSNTTRYSTQAGHHQPVHDRSINDRQARQQKAIERGRRSGRITWREGRKLRREQKRIARLEDYFRNSDRRLDRFERHVLHIVLDAARDHIRAQKRDGQRRWSSLPRFGR
ncbi:MAG: hypothetical protein K0U74_05740 [Alphaproteobacteria bacterium]|nr:hypothetical protein [Alphaproteobacteria bacterium]